MNALPWTIYVSFAGAAVLLLLGRASPALARGVALATALLGAALGAAGAAGFTARPGLQTLVDAPWVAGLGIRYHLAADGISLVLVLLTGLAATAGVLFSWNLRERVAEFFALYFLLLGGVYGVFLSADAFLLFVFYEIAIVPKYFLIANWGSTNREYAAMKLVLYSFAGSALVLAGLLWAHAAGGGRGFGLAELVRAASGLPAAQQVPLFGLLFVGFGVLAGLFPFHTWAPTGHVAAPTGVSMLLAGVVMKLGAYGCLRVALPLCPLGFAAWQPVLGGLALAGILYAGFVALAQEDFKFVIGYSSVSHMGFVLLGLAAATPQALAGAVLQMFSHGVIAGLLFAVVGRMVYERVHTRRLDRLQALGLHRHLPFPALVFVLAALASMGMPGFSGFPAELSILIGTWRTAPLWALGAAGGVVVAAAFTLRVLQVSFFGPADPAPAAEPPPPPDPEPITWPERAGAALLLAATIYVGLKPDALLGWILPALQSPALQPLLRGNTP